ncbi:MAG TPA: hypothetical protein VFH56_12035 [Acidimicrobiales bacterium]|nr:hypothetical protein [Acidimicrobiales bacterium]
MNDDDAMEIVHVDVTNPDGVTFPAVLTGGGFAKAGVVSFFVEPEDAPVGEESGDRCEFFRAVPGVDRPVYQVRRATAVDLEALRERLRFRRAEKIVEDEAKRLRAGEPRAPLVAGMRSSAWPEPDDEPRA